MNSKTDCQFYYLRRVFAQNITKFTRVRDPSYFKVKVSIRAKWPIRPELIQVSVARSDQEYFYYPLDGMLVHHRVTPSIKFASTHLERHYESKVSCPGALMNVPGQGLDPKLQQNFRKSSMQQCFLKSSKLRSKFPFIRIPMFACDLSKSDPNLRTGRSLAYFRAVSRLLAINGVIMGAFLPMENSGET